MRGVAICEAVPVLAPCVRWGAATLLAVSLLAGSLAGSRPASASPRTCQVSATKLVLRTARAEIRATRVDPLEGEFDQTYYGCVRRTRRSFALFDVGTSSHIQETVRFPRLAGVFAAFDIRTIAADGTCYSTIALYDLRRRRRIHHASAASAKPVGTVCEPDVAALVLTDFGAAGWVTAPNADGFSEVRKVDRDGQRTLDSGLIASASLHLRGDRLFWTGGGQQRAATLR